MVFLVELEEEDEESSHVSTTTTTMQQWWHGDSDKRLRKPLERRAWQKNRTVQSRSKRKMRQKHWHLPDKTNLLSPTLRRLLPTSSCLVKCQDEEKNPQQKICSLIKRNSNWFSNINSSATSEDTMNSTCQRAQQNRHFFNVQTFISRNSSCFTRATVMLISW